MGETSALILTIVTEGWATKLISESDMAPWVGSSRGEKVKLFAILIGGGSLLPSYSSR